MYENKHRLHGYAKKCLHKNKLKKRFAQAKSPCTYRKRYNSWKDCIARMGNFADDYWYIKGWDGAPRQLEYWKNYQISGCRRFAKRATNRVLRAQKKAIWNREGNDVALHGAEYRKMFDYDWTIW